jgi:tRNA (guanine37-N1)-methyltransferase
VSNESTQVGPLGGTTSLATATEEEVMELTRRWRSLPALNTTINFRSWIVPQGKHLQSLIQHKAVRPYLATRHALLEHVHQRVKVVRSLPDENHELSATSKLVLLHPDAPAWEDASAEIHKLLETEDSDFKVQDGPLVPLALTYKNFTAAYLLEHALPKEVHPVPTAFETIGHVAHLNLRTRHLPYRYMIGQILLESLPTIETVILKVGEVQGPYRTYDLEVLAGRPDTQVNLSESGVSLQFDVKNVYWCSRLSEERQRLLRSEIKDGQWVADVFCGVGALVLQAAKHKNCRISANDWNPDAVDALRSNIALNGVSDKFVDIRCGDAYEFLMDLGVRGSESSQMPDHIHMNYPLEAPSFLGALRWWPLSNQKHTQQQSLHTAVAPRVHVYTFAKADATTNRSAEDVAVDIVAEELLPMGESTTHRLNELNQEYDCNVNVHNVRDVAPGKLVICVSFSATDKLIRYMQGDFS